MSELVSIHSFGTNNHIELIHLMFNIFIIDKSKSLLGSLDRNIFGGIKVYDLINSKKIGINMRVLLSIDSLLVKFLRQKSSIRGGDYIRKSIILLPNI